MKEHTMNEEQMKQHRLMLHHLQNIVIEFMTMIKLVRGARVTIPFMQQVDRICREMPNNNEVILKCLDMYEIWISDRDADSERSNELPRKIEALHKIASLEQNPNKEVRLKYFSLVCRVGCDNQDLIFGRITDNSANSSNRSYNYV